MSANPAERAVELFGSGFNCAESVLSVLCDRLSKRGRRYASVVPCAATGFGGGIGRSGSTCGALSGVVLTVGLVARHDRAVDWEKKYMVYDLVSKTIMDFEKEFGSSLCRDLTGCNLRDEQERLRFNSERIQDKMCSKFVKWCVDYGSLLIDRLGK